MVVDLTGFALDFVAQYGLAAIFLLLVLDAAMLLPGLPGELFIILAVTLYAENQAGLVLVIAVATLAATLGSLLLYGIARAASRRTSPPGERRLFAVSARRKARLERTFGRPTGQSLVFFARLFPFTRLLVNLPAGVARMRVGPFLLLTFLGNLVFHATLMWLAYQSRQPGSRVAARAEALHESYASPAWTYVQTNWALVALVGVGLAFVLSIRAAVRTRRNPEEGYQGSLVGFAARTTLLWGGVAVLAGLWIDPDFVYDAVALAGWDVRSRPVGLPLEPASVVAAVGAAAILLAWIASRFTASARRAVRRVRRSATPGNAPPAPGPGPRGPEGASGERPPRPPPAG